MNKFVITLLLLVFSQNIFSQNRITYHVILDLSFNKKFKNRLKRASTRDKVIDNVKKLLNDSEIVDAKLNFNKEESIFELQKKEMTNEGAINITAMFAGGESKYYSNSHRKINIEEVNFLGDDFLVKREYIKKWQLLNETKMIHSYTCYKAILNTKKKKVEAWYALDLPFNFGPKDFNGLPGVILELKDNKVTYRVKKNELNLKDYKKITQPAKGRKITEKEFDKLLKKNSPF